MSAHLDNAHTLKLGKALLIVWHSCPLRCLLIIPMAPGVIVPEDTVADVPKGIHAGESHKVEPNSIWNPFLYMQTASERRHSLS